MPSKENVMLQHSQLANCRICLLPPRLLLTLASLLSSPKTEVTVGSVTTDLLSLNLSFLPAGSTQSNLISSLQQP
jgi:hypothetical protein